jgi:cation transport ATPase
MNAKDPLQQNIERTTAIHALKKIGDIVEKENRDNAATARAVRRFIRYGLVLLFVLVGVLAYLLGVY